MRHHAWPQTRINSVSTADELSSDFFFQTCNGEVTRVLKEHLSYNEILVSLALHIFGNANLLHLPSSVFLAHQKGWPAVLNPTNPFQHWVCAKNSIRHCEGIEMNGTQTKCLKNLNSVGRQAAPTTVMQSRATVCPSASVGSTLDALQTEQLTLTINTAVKN